MADLNLHFQWAVYYGGTGRNERWEHRWHRPCALMPYAAAPAASG